MLKRTPGPRRVMLSLLAALAVMSESPAQPLPGHINPTGHKGLEPAASRPTDVPVTRREGGPGPLDSLELARSLLEVERASADASATSLIQRLIPRITLSASFGLGEIVFRDPSTDALTLLPRDSYRLTFSLGIDQLVRSHEHDQALVRLRSAEQDFSRTRMQIAERGRVREADEDAGRQALVLLAAELELVRQLVTYDEMLFAEGKIEFDALVRAKLQLLNLQRAIARADRRSVPTD
jgi:hypothetical protein